MHELSIAISIVELAEEEMEQRGVQVIGVHFKLGVLPGVVAELRSAGTDEDVCPNASKANQRLFKRINVSVEKSPR
jgi:hydrogenase nickel incorporation protein HypA/HybF